MALKKNRKYDLKAKYNRALELGFIGSLIFLIGAFKFFPVLDAGPAIKTDSQEIINVEDVIATKREALPPPPPKPPIPVEAPQSDIEMEDIELAISELDENADVTGPPPPPIKDSQDEEPVFFVAVEQLPEPIGGIAAILAKLEYPPMAKRAGVQGKVYVKAYVDQNGVVKKVELIKGIGAGCDEEALKAVLNTRFYPGKQRGKPVKVQMNVPIKFVLK